MDADRLIHPVVKAAIDAMNAVDRDAWLALFAADAILTDDESERDFKQWSDSEIFGAGKGRITAVTQIADRGTTIHADFHSARWGDFKTFWKFGIQSGKIMRLDVGQEDGRRRLLSCESPTGPSPRSGKEFRCTPSR